MELAPEREVFRGVLVGDARVVILELGAEEIARALGRLRCRHVERRG
jgi:hypothetical protein